MQLCASYRAVPGSRKFGSTVKAKSATVRGPVRVLAFKADQATQPPTATPSKTALLKELEASTARGNVYGKPLSKSEESALQATIQHVDQEMARRGDIVTKDSLQKYLLAYLTEAAKTKAAPLNICEGAMVILEQMYLMEAKGNLKCSLSEEEMLCRWQLVIGADVGSIQYIPVVEELQVFPGGDKFNLDTDLDFMFTGFSGDSSWISPGHLQYHVQRVRLELRKPKGWQRFGTWLKWRSEQANKGLSHYNDEEAEPDYGMGAADAPTCRPDMSRGGWDLPLPFPVNELFIYCSNGDVATLRSKLGGLIMLVNKTPKSQRSTLLKQSQ